MTDNKDNVRDAYDKAADLAWNVKFDAMTGVGNEYSEITKPFLEKYQAATKKHWDAYDAAMKRAQEEFEKGMEYET